MVVDENPRPSVFSDPSLPNAFTRVGPIEPEGNPGPANPGLNPGPTPGVFHNPGNGLGAWLEQNWKPLALGAGIALFLAWIFTSKKE